MSSETWYAIVPGHVSDRDALNHIAGGGRPYAMYYDRGEAQEFARPWETVREITIEAREVK